jgi:hypothetical protein
VPPTLEDVQVERPADGTAVVVFSGEHDLATKDEVTNLLESLLREDDLFGRRLLVGFLRRLGDARRAARYKRAGA